MPHENKTEREHSQQVLDAAEKRLHDLDTDEAATEYAAACDAYRAIRDEHHREIEDMLVAVPNYLPGDVARMVKVGGILDAAKVRREKARREPYSVTTREMIDILYDYNDARLFYTLVRGRCLWFAHLWLEEHKRKVTATAINSLWARMLRESAST
jgi:hypothetical protein